MGLRVGFSGTAMLNSSVLVLNRSYLPIHVTSARRAFSLLYQGIARVVDEQYQTFDFDRWSQLAVARDEEAIGTARGRIRIPRVIVLVAFDRLPKRHVRFSRINLMARDNFQCQYCGDQPVRSDLNLDHVVPRALGGRSTWENVVTSCLDCNRLKGGRTPHQAGMRLVRRPARPRWTPLMNLVLSSVRYKEWRPFLNVVDASYWNVELVE
jgi:5-methylcytosine-specific restriction endonuclease McrA